MQPKSSYVRKLTAAVGVVAVSGLLAACSGGSSAGGDSAEGELKDTYVVATDNSFVPFEFEENGEIVGFDIDIINEVADRAGFKVDLKTSNFDGIIPGLQTGSFDLAIAGITITDERRNAVDFTSPYYKSGTRIGVPVGTTDIQSLEDLAGKNVATRLGSAPADYLAAEVPDANVSTFEQLDQAYLSVEGGSTDAIFYDAPNVEYYVSTRGEGTLEVVGPLYEAQFYGIAVSKGNEALVEAANVALLEMMKDGTYAKIAEKWFGETPEWVDELVENSDAE